MKKQVPFTKSHELTCPVFIFVPLAGALVIWFLFPETSNLTLEEIGVLFGDKVGHPVGVNGGHGIDGVEVAQETETRDVLQGKEKMSVDVV